MKNKVQIINPDSFNCENHWYPKALNATIHPMVNFFLNMDKNSLMASHIKEELSYSPKGELFRKDLRNYNVDSFDIVLMRLPRNWLLAIYLLLRVQKRTLAL